MKVMCQWYKEAFFSQWSPEHRDAKKKFMKCPYYKKTKNKACNEKWIPHDSCKEHGNMLNDHQCNCVPIPFDLIMKEVLKNDG